MSTWDQSQRDSPFTVNCSLPIHYKRAGRGLPVLLLHGSGSSLQGFEQVAIRLSESFGVIRPDLPGYGLTGSRPDRDYRIPTYATAVAEFMAILGVASYAVVGNSLGGNIAWNLALDQPQQVAGLVLINATGYPGKSLPGGLRLARNQLLRPLLRRWLPRSGTERSPAGLGHRVKFGTELTQLKHGDESVTAILSVDSKVLSVTARYVVGADGGSSVVRKEMGIAFTGLTDEQDRMLIVDAAVEGLRRDRWHVWPGARGRFVGACPLPHSDLFQWMIRPAPPEVVPGDEAAISKRIQSRIRDPRVKLRGVQWKSLYRPNIRIAEGYRLGRVFLAGDAAHVHPPAGAQGLNTGIQDAYNLGRKLAQVLAGADPSLLDSYETERLPIASGVLGLATKKYEAIAKLHPSSLQRGTDESQPLVSHRGGPLAPDSTASTSKVHVGDRAPNVELTDAEGARVRLLDVFRGPHFTLIAYGPSAAAALDQLEWPGAGASLKRVVANASAARADHTLADTTRSLQRRYGPGRDTLILVRPDGYLGQIASSKMRTTTRAATRAMTPWMKTPEATTSRLL